MKLKLAITLSCLISITSGWTQSKVFKTVSNEISSGVMAITQDQSLVGYLQFTRLEEASKDSFNYQISILDENLNDIGKVNFRQKILQLKSISFDQDVLCLVYLIGIQPDYRTETTIRMSHRLPNENYILTQLINLEGKIIYSETDKINLRINTKKISVAKYADYPYTPGNLKHNVLLKNIPGKGFAISYGDEDGTQIRAFDFSGKEIWKQAVAPAHSFRMLNTSTEVYLLTKTKRKSEGDYEIRGYNSEDGTPYETYRLTDKKGNQLKVLDFLLDPATGRPYVTGMIINAEHGDEYQSTQALTKGPYDGVFAINLNGPKISDIKEQFSYWQDGSKVPEITNVGGLGKLNIYPRISTTIRDFKGNSLFIGSCYIHKVMKPIQTDIALLNLDSSGKLSLLNLIDLEDNKFGSLGFEIRNFYTTTNTSKQTNFLIIAGEKRTVVYNVTEQKIIREVPRQKDKTETIIYPAKDGYIMVVERNEKEKETKLSIESL